MAEVDRTKIDIKQVPCYVEQVHIRGLARTKDEYVKKELKDVFESRTFNDIVLKSEEVRQRLYKLGCFKSIDILIDASENKSSKSLYDVYYDVEEFNVISGGIHTSVGNNEGSLNGSISFPNLFGKGEKAWFEYSYGTRHNTDYRVNFQSPLQMNPDKNVTLSLHQTQNDYPWSKFKQNEMGINVNLSMPFRINFGSKATIDGRHDLTYEGTWRNLLPSVDTTFDIREQSGHSLKSSIKYTYSIDRRTNQALPEDGGFLKASVELAGLGGDVKFAKFNKDYSYSKTLFKYFIAQFTLSSGSMTPLGEDKKINISDRFFLGGPLTLRGFTMRGVGPSKEDCSLGNDSYWLFGAHVYTPLPFFHRVDKLNWLKTHTFINIGNLFSLNNLRTSPNRWNILADNARMSIGSGLVIRFANMARLELNYAYPLWKHQQDKVINGLQFGIGIAFN